MNRRFAWAWGLVTAAIALIAGGIGYAAGQANHVVTATGADGRLVYPGYWGPGFFPIFPLFGLFWILLIGFLLFRLFYWRPWGGGWGPGGGYWHRHPSDQGGNSPASGQTPQQTSA